MEYHKINLLSNTPNQPSKFKTKYWVELNYDSHGTYNTNSRGNKNLVGGNSTGRYFFVVGMSN